MKVLGLIIARGGSKGVPGKHVRPMAGKRVIDHVIDFATSDPVFDTVAFSTDSDELLDIAREAGIVAIERPAEMATSESSITPTLVHALDFMKSEHGKEFDVISVMYGCVPYRPKGCMAHGMDLLESSGATAVRSYCPVWKFFPEFMVKMEGDRVSPYMNTPNFRRQDMPDLFYPDGAVILARTEVVRASIDGEGGYDHHYLGDDLRGFVLDFPGPIEIDEEFDVAFANAVMTGAFGEMN